jgi:hypothetical protein
MGDGDHLDCHEEAALADKLSEALEEAERRSAKKRARIAAFQRIERCLKAIYDADLNRPIPARFVLLLETSVTSD